MQTKFDKSCVSRMLSALRREKNVTQATVAYKLNVSDKTYSRWETGEALPDMEALAALAEYFHVSPSVFFDENASDGVEQTVRRMYADLSLTEQVHKGFEIMFHTIRTLSENAFNDQSWNLSDLMPPENRVWAGHKAMTSTSFNDVYAMMYNGTDANIALSILPNQEKYAWLTDPGEREKLSAMFALLADRDMLAMLPHILSASCALNYTSGYIAERAGIDPARAEALLSEAARIGICRENKAWIGKAEINLYSTAAEHTLTGLLILCYLTVNREQIASFVTPNNGPGKITFGGDKQ